MNILDQLKRDEDFRSKPYRDTSKAIGFEGRAGKVTIGYGRNLDDEGISLDEGLDLLQSDVNSKVAALQRALPWAGELLSGDDAPRFWVLVNMAFNMGLEGLLGFHRMLSAMEKKQWEIAASEMLDPPNWLNQVGDRARRLAEQMRTGQWQ